MLNSKKGRLNDKDQKPKIPEKTPFNNSDILNKTKKSPSGIHIIKLKEPLSLGKESNKVTLEMLEEAKKRSTGVEGKEIIVYGELKKDKVKGVIGDKITNEEAEIIKTKMPKFNFSDKDKYMIEVIGDWDRFITILETFDEENKTKELAVFYNSDNINKTIAYFRKNGRRPEIIAIAFSESDVELVVKKEDKIHTISCEKSNAIDLNSL